MGGRRIAWIDVARAAGAVSIVFLHVLVSTQIACELSLARQVAYAALGITLTRWAVPSFFMVSGFLLLDTRRAMGWGRALGYARRMVVVLATFGVVFALMEEVFNARAAGVGISAMLLVDAVRDVLVGRTWDHLWYVYAALATYLVLPFLHRLKSQLGERRFAVFAAILYACVLVVPTLTRFEMPNVLIAIACVSVGGCLALMRLGAPLVLCGLGSLAVMLGVSVSGVLAGRGDEGFIFLQGSCFACAWGALILAWLRERVPEDVGVSRLVATLAHESFGIYLIHPLYVHLLLFAVDPATLPPVLFEAGATLGVLGISYATSVALRRIPILDDVL